jgi:hypothetical protein
MPFRILWTGSRDWINPSPIHRGLENAVKRAGDRRPVLVHGACGWPNLRGADRIAHLWALSHGISVEPHPAEAFGPWPECGPLRNQHMVSLGADLCLAVIGPCTSSRCRRSGVHPSHGASGCADMAQGVGITTYRYYHSDLRQSK